MQEQNGYYIIDEPELTPDNAAISFAPLELKFDNSLIKYTIKANNKTNQLQVDRELGAFLKQGDYLHTYIVVDSTAIPEDLVLKLVDENGEQLYSPFSADGEYIKTECQIKGNNICAIPLPADYNSNKDWVDFESGIYDWKLVSVETEFYESISLDLRIEII